MREIVWCHGRPLPVVVWGGMSLPTALSPSLSDYRLLVFVFTLSHQRELALMTSHIPLLSLTQRFSILQLLLACCYRAVTQNENSLNSSWPCCYCGWLQTLLRAVTLVTVVEERLSSRRSFTRVHRSYIHYLPPHRSRLLPSSTSPLRPSFSPVYLGASPSASGHRWGHCSSSTFLQC